MGANETLSEADRSTLDFEARRWRYAGAKEVAIREQLGLTPTRYAMRLNALLDEPAALTYAPVLVHRLRRLRAARRVPTRV